MDLDNIRIGFAMTGSFCTFSNAFEAAQKLIDSGAKLTPIMSFNASSINSRFGKAKDHIAKIEQICSNKAILTIEDAEHIGPKSLFDIVIVCPCTGNTMAKLALGITDTPTTMSVKANLRNGKPVVLCSATNDALSASAKNIGALMNTKGYYFVPLFQDDYKNKQTSLVADFSLITQTIKCALDGVQIQPVLKTI